MSVPSDVKNFAKNPVQSVKHFWNNTRWQSNQEWYMEALERDAARRGQNLSEEELVSQADSHIDEEHLEIDDPDWPSDLPPDEQKIIIEKQKNDPARKEAKLR